MQPTIAACVSWVWVCIGCNCKTYKHTCKFLPNPTSMFLYTCTCVLETIALCLQFCQHIPDNLETSGFPFTRHFPTMACPPSLQWFQYIGKEEVLTLWGQMPHTWEHTILAHNPGPQICNCLPPGVKITTTFQICPTTWWTYNGQGMSAKL